MINVRDLPADIQRLCMGATWQEITIGCSGDQVFHIVHPQGHTYYLKVATHPLEQELIAEHQRLVWLRGRLPVPTVLAFSHEDEHTYLLLSEIPGLMSFDKHFTQNVSAIVQLLAEGLRLIHNVDITNCPFSARLVPKFALAEQRTCAGLIDEADFDDERKGMHADELLKQLFESRPATEDIVFTHGDFCLPNVLIDPAHLQLSGFIDLGRAGIADRYQDLALAARSLARNFGPEWVPLLWEVYGLEVIDSNKLAFYQLLDEFF